MMLARLRTASRQDWTAIAELLRANQLPTDGVTTDVDHLYVLEVGGRVAGAIGFESYPPDALLRSLVVDPGLRGRGHGGTLLRLALQEAHREGIRTVYGLTTTIPDWLSRLGFEEIKKDQIPAAVHRSWELRGARPGASRAVRMRL